MIEKSLIVFIAALLLTACSLPARSTNPLNSSGGSATSAVTIASPTASAAAGSLPTQTADATETYGGNLDKSDYQFTITYQGIERRYNVHLPKNYDKNVPTPAVMYLHGGGGSLKSGYLDGLVKYSDKHNFILVLPEGTGPIPGILLQWNIGKYKDSYPTKHNIDDVGYISKVIDDVSVHFNLDKTRIYATGISNGAAMAELLACQLSDKIAAVSLVAPSWKFDDCAPERKIPVMIIRGTADPIALYDGGVRTNSPVANGVTTDSAQEIVDFWREKNNCSADSSIVYQNGSATCRDYKDDQGNPMVEFCSIIGGGHTWPSGDQYAPASKVGPVSYDMSTDQIWDFFQRYSLGGFKS